MSNIFMNATLISIIFLIIKFFEMRFIEKENKPLKLLIRDTLVVFSSVVLSDFLLKQFNPVIHSSGGATQVFTDNPDF